MMMEIKRSCAPLTYQSHRLMHFICATISIWQFRTSAISVDIHFIDRKTKTFFVCFSIKYNTLNQLRVFRIKDVGIAYSTSLLPNLTLAV